MNIVHMYFIFMWYYFNKSIFYKILHLQLFANKLINRKEAKKPNLMNNLINIININIIYI